MSIFRNTLQPTVQAQLKVRQDALKLRTSDAIIHANSRNSWIRMTSSVNVEGKDTLANQYILQGGVLLNGVLGRIPRSGVGNQAYAYSNESPSGKSYNDPNRKAGTAGIKPMPGIKSIDVKSKSAYGSLREVTVNFSCHNIQQLEDLELLYMRPGYTVLIEWGWAPYLNKDGKIENNIEFYDGVLKGGKTREQVWLEIYELSKKKHHNYDAMYGYVKNYNWTARMDGGYDCTTTIISIGEIMESLKAGYLPFDINDAAKKNIGDDSELSQRPETIEETKNFYSKNKLAGLCKNLYNICLAKKDPFSNDGNYFTFSPSKSISGTPYNMFAFNYLLSNNDLKDEFLKGSIQGYITLESFIDMLNSYVLLHAGKDQSKTTPIITLSTKLNKYEDKGEPLLCLAHPLQVSVDPTICLITNPLWAKGIDFEGVDDGDENETLNPYNDEAEIIYKLLRDVSAGDDENPIGQKLLDTIGFKQVNPPYDLNIDLNTDIIINAKEFVKAFYFVVEKFNKAGNSQNFHALLYKLSNNLDQLLFKSYTTTPEQTKIGNDTWDILIRENQHDAIKKEIEAERILKQKVAEEAAKKIAQGYSPDGIEYLTNLEKNNSNQFQNKSETGFIGNIYLNIAFLYRMSIESSIYDPKTRDLKLYDYLIKILKEVQESIGGVNNFEIHVDPIDNVARIIDVNYVDLLSKKDAYDKAFLIEAQNLSGTVRSYNLQSKIFPEQGAMIAIGAQVKGGNTQGTPANTLLDFNNGLEDRIIPKKLEPFTSTSNDFTSKYDKLKNNINKIKSLFIPLPKDAPPNNSNSTPASTDQASNSEYKSALKDLIVYFQEIGETNTNGRSIIPVQISLTMDGIGGLVIGHLFKIPPDLLPRGYGSDNVGGKLIQTITSIGHKVENGDWTTTIDALNIVTKDSLNDRKKLKFNDLLTERKDSFAIKALEPPNVTGSYFDRATNFIKKFEGFLRTPKPDSDGKLRGGYGSPVKWDKEGNFSGMVNEKTTFTEEEATYTLKYNIKNTYEPLAKNAIGIETWVKLTDNQKAALISYVYNTGTERLKDKNITQYLKEGNYKLAADAIKSGPITAKNEKGIREEVPGLVTRRQQESILFLTP